jgi:hypothetical protein
MSNKILIIICSYNSKNHTKKVYDELKLVSNIDLMVLDNSSSLNLISNFDPFIHIGTENVEYGGMHDFILNMNKIYDYEYVGIFNNDIFGFTQEHFNILEKYLNSEVGYISFSISSKYDKFANIMYPITNSFREVNFIENVASIYNIRLLKELSKYVPIHKYALIDKFMSSRCNELGLKNIIIDEISFHHLRSGVRKEVNTFDQYILNHVDETNKWISKYPELRKYF